MAKRKSEKTYDEKRNRQKVPVGLRLDADVLERLRNLVFWMGQGLSVNSIVESGAIKELEALEAKYQKANGKPVPPRTGSVPRSGGTGPRKEG